MYIELLLLNTIYCFKNFTTRLTSQPEKSIYHKYPCSTIIVLDKTVEI